VKLGLDTYDPTTDTWSNTLKAKAFDWAAGNPNITKGKCAAALNNELISFDCGAQSPIICQK